ncbi:lysophospholipase [Trinickia caryophylli]|uniref:Monoacylglycerol lipase n=1 Tax=Trinickia caryophylli TaxID=28094 RepID=A0A1X7DVZ1_TRICW|nr:alpha/beta hydrolase [Trinickia caryophylli]PMS14237.1 alpha/beta hydrolase [Trinickia caryophylli]TRX17936.1 lysophospholipase [Trinickia caryophylli]WQE11289.1 alpha/beta hydrolase [Trinickia caryophylli]SMF22855.1 Lysophospholipase, alpha-beta hydrolase superfamily [Trinickia caryophylli]GLU32438.1 hydrolase [Trinickia caryophylli]
MASVEAESAPSGTDAQYGTIRAADGQSLALYRWLPRRDAAPRAVVALVHGLAEHAGRYAALAERLNAAGIELVAIDLRGHGRSPGPRAWVTRIDEYLLDLEALLAAAARPGVPLFLMGHSMGGAIAALFAVERLARFAAGHRPVAGLVLSSAALAPGRDVPRWMIVASRIVSRLWPRFPAMRIEPALLSRDPAVVEANRRDPLVHHGGIPARTGAEILAAMARIERGRGGLTLPVLVFHGSEDKLTEPDGSRAFAAQVGSRDRTLAIYNGSYHETMNDLDRTEVIAALAGWILARATP